MQRLQRLQPEMKAIQAKYKDDKQRQQQELMKFYKENQVNPLGSCLPLVAQLPVFISLFYMLRSSLRADICPQVQPHHIVNGHERHRQGAHGSVRPERRRQLPVHPRPDEQGDGRGACRPDRALRRHAAGVEPDDVEPDDGQDAAADHVGDAAVVRRLHHQLPGRRDRVLDHDEHVDDRPAIRGRRDASGRRRRRRRPADDGAAASRWWFGPSPTAGGRSAT